MDYDDVEPLASCVPVIFPAGMLVLIGFLVHKRRSTGALRWEALIGLVASLVYAFVALELATALVPHPNHPYFASVLGLDLRGITLALGSWVGALIGTGTALIVFGVCQALNRKALRAVSTEAPSD